MSDSDATRPTYDTPEDEVEAVVALITAGLEASDAWGRHVFKWHGGGYMVQTADRGCCEYETAEDAARAFLLGAQRWDR